MKPIIISIVLLLALIGGVVILFSVDGGSQEQSSADVNNVSMVDGKQIVKIGAKGGYSPRVTAARANIPTLLKIQTMGTFDCSSALVIPSLGYRNNLPSSGETFVELGSQQPGSIIQGLCAMGMYSFKIEFN